jgi:hypothetical protein
MAIEIVNNQDTIDNFKTKVNTLSRLIGDLSLLDIKDSNVMDAINRIDITDISGAIVARADVDSAALVAYRVLQDSATAADTLARALVTLQDWVSPTLSCPVLTQISTLTGLPTKTVLLLTQPTIPTPSPLTAPFILG